MAASELDRKFDAAFAAVTGPGGRIALGKDAAGRAIVTNLPPTLPSFFKAFCALHGGIELVSGDERLTFAELDALSDRLARGLVARGVAKGDRLGIAMKNCSSWILAYMAGAKAGAILTLINGWWQPHELAHALQLTEPRLVLADGPRAQRIAAADGAWDVVALDVDQPADRALADLLADPADSTPLPEVLPSDDATILFTSGSTGEAKGAVSTHLAVTTATYTYATHLASMLGVLVSEGRPPPNPIKTLVSVPLFHVTGEIPVMLNSFVIGRGMVLMAKWDAEAALDLIAREKVTYFVGVPTMSLELMNHPARGRYDVSSLTDIAAGGAPRPASHVSRLRDTFPTAKPALGYGLTETNAVGCGNFWENYADKPLSTGRAHPPFVELAILDDAGRPVPVGQPGEIAIRSAANFRGYWGNPDATDEAFTPDGYFKTGDVGYLDAEAYLFIVDRKKDIIIRGGENISAAEVEAAVYACPSVAEAAVFGIADERLGEVPVAVVRAKDGETLDADGLRAFLAERLAAYKLPARICLVETPLPRLGTGKFDRLALKQHFA